MEDDHRVWPEGPRRRRTPPEDTEPAWGARRGEEQDPPWNPQLRRTADREEDPWRREDDTRARSEDPWQEEAQDSRLPWESLPPSARHYGTPTAPHRMPVRRRAGRRVGAVLALVVASGLLVVLVVSIMRAYVPEPVSNTLTDTEAGVTIPLPTGWAKGAVPPVTGFTSVARNHDQGAVLMARPLPGGGDVKEAAEIYSQLILQGDTVAVVADTPASRSLRAEYKDVVNRPAYLRVMILTRDGRSALLLGLLQPDESTGRQALDALMESVR